MDNQIYVEESSDIPDPDAEGLIPVTYVEDQDDNA